jgi:hypothetical protein
MGPLGIFLVMLNASIEPQRTLAISTIDLTGQPRACTCWKPVRLYGQLVPRGESVQIGIMCACCGHVAKWR